MKKALSLILAVMMLLGCMSITAFAKGKTGKSDSTDITLTVAKSLTYDMVIPEDVTDIDNFGIFEVGQAKVADVKNATENTVISYTAETTAFKSEGKSDIPASYYIDAVGSEAFPTEAVTVYEVGSDAANIPTMYVGISETDWNAAENGTYTATVTFNFTAEEAEAPAAVTAADALVTGAQYRVTIENGMSSSNTICTFEKTSDGFTVVSIINGTSDVTEQVASTYVSDSTADTIKLTSNGFFELTVNTNNNTYTLSYSLIPFTYKTFEVKPAGATEFTEITLTKAE